MQLSNEMEYIDVESEYKQFVEDFVSFLEYQSEECNKPTLAENAESYLLSIGVPQAQIDAVRNIMIEK